MHRWQDVGSRPSLAFPPGTTLDDALTNLFVAVAERGALPDGARLAQPLPPGKVAALPQRPEDPLLLSLVAPFGYDLETGFIFPPHILVRNVTSPAERSAVEKAIREARDAGKVLPPRAELAFPVLYECQLLNRQLLDPKLLNIASQQAPSC